MRTEIHISEILENLISSKRLAGSISGGRQDKALYVPDIYTKSQTEWVDNFYTQNGYLGRIMAKLFFMLQVQIHSMYI